MISAQEIEAQFADTEKSLDSKLYSPLEKAAIWTAIAAFTIVSFGSIFVNDLFWTDGLKPIVWDPIVKDAGAAGDAGYSTENTALYALTVLMSVVILKAVFRQIDNAHV